MYYITFLIIFSFVSIHAVNKDNNEPLSLEVSATHPYNIANFTSTPNGIIHGCVNVITGDFFDTQEDLYIEGPEPLNIRRSYSSSDNTPGTLLNAWHLSYQGKLTEASVLPEAPYQSEFEPETRRTRDRERRERDGGPERALASVPGSKHYASYVGPMGMKLSFSRARDKSIFILTKEELKYGITNCSGPEISARTNIKNTSLKYDRNKTNKTRLATLVQPNNSRLYFKKAKKDSRLILDTEVLPSAAKLTYDYDKNDRLCLVQAFNPNGSVLNNFVLQWPESFDDCPIVTLIGSDQKKVYYKFRKKHKRFFLLEEVNRPDAPSEYYTYTSRSINPEDYVLTRKDRPDGRALEISYYQKGTNSILGGAISLKNEHPNIGRVKTLKAPVGHDATLYTTHQFLYHFPNNTIGEGTCGVYDIHGVKTDYRWNDNLQLTHVLKFDKAGNPYSVDFLEWEDFNGHSRTNLKSRSFLGDNKTYYKVTYCYDEHGNVPEEIFEGTIRGAGESDRLVTRRQFTQDKLRLKQVEDNGLLHKTYTYKEGSSLLSSCITRGDGKIQVREFFDYDCNNVLVQKTIDDAQSADRHSLDAATFRKIYRNKPRTTTAFNLPEVEEAFYLDLNTQQEILLYREVNTYTHAGKLIRKDRYDALNQYAYSLGWEYDGQGNLIEEIDALGRRITRRYDNNQNCIFQQGPATDSYQEHFYDFSNRLILTREIHPDGALCTSYHYNGLSQLIRKVDPFGHETHYHYDEFGRLVSTLLPSLVTPDGQLNTPQVKNTYNAFNQLTSTTDANGFTTHYTPNVFGKPLLIQHPDGSTNKFEYDIYGRQIKAIAKNGSITQTTYDCLGRSLEETLLSAAGEILSKTQSKYTSQLMSFTDPEGHETLYHYDGAGRVVKEISGTRAVSFEYDSLGRMWRKTHHADSPVIYETEYDVLDRITAERVLTQDGTIQTEVFYKYDQAGNRTHVIQEIDGREAVLHTLYDSHGQPIVITDAEGNQTRISYDYHYRNQYGQRVFYKEEVDSRGITTISVYDPYGRIVSNKVKDPHGTIIQEREVFFDANGNLIQSREIVHEEQESRNTILNYFEYNSVNDITKETYAVETPEQKTVAYTYNSAGQLESIIKADGVVLHHAYDALGRLTRLKSSDSSVDYAYFFDRNGNITEVKDLIKQNSLQRTYDEHGEMSSETLPNGACLKYLYDGFGHLKTMTLPDQTTVSYEHEGIHLKHIQRGKSTHTYAFDKSGRVKQSGERKTSFNPRGLVSSITHSKWKASYTYDEVGSLIHSLINGNKNEFAYDSLYQLKNEKGQTNHSYKYDSLYNRLEKDGKKNTYNSLNQLIVKDAQNLTYDANGNLLSDGDLEFKYDALDRLVSVTKKGQTYTYTYDAFNRRISKTTSKTTTRYIYQGSNEIGALDAKGKIFELRILGIGLGAEIGAAVFMELNGKNYKPIHDAQGNVVCLLDGDKSAAEYSYSAFGELTNKSTSYLSPWLFSSKRYDQETGFIYFGRRYYSPETGRWITPDPIGHEGGPNLYAYVFNSPHLSIDLYGLMSHSLGGQAIEHIARGDYERSVRDTERNKSLSDYFFEGVQSYRTNPAYAVACHLGLPGILYNASYEKELTEYRGSLSFTENLSFQLGQTLDLFIGVPDSFEDAALNVACMVSGPIGKGVKYGRVALNSSRTIIKSSSVVSKVSKANKIPGDKFSQQAKAFMQKNVKPITRSNMKIGQHKHKEYKRAVAGEKEFVLPSGRRPDFVDDVNNIIYELKPHNPRAIRDGFKQLESYQREIQNMPRFKDKIWTIELETY